MKIMEEYLQNLIKASGVTIVPGVIDSSIYNQGNRIAIANIIRRVLHGENITVCAFGGSITEGMDHNEDPCAESGIEHSLPEMNYLDYVCDFVEKMFQVNVAKINAGIAATDTVFAVHRMQDDVLKYTPDLVIVEWCCNDGMDVKYKQATYEGMVRRLLEAGTAVIMLSMADRSGYSSQALHEPISDWYDVPMLSYRDAYLQLKEYPYLTNDGVHPNIVGHALVGILLVHYLMKIHGELGCIGNIVPICRKDTFCKEAPYYQNAKIVTLKEIYEGEVPGIKILDVGSFHMDEVTTSFAYRQYYGFSAGYAEQYAPLIIEVDTCKTVFLQIYRNSMYDGTSFWVELNAEKIENKTFTCKHGSDNEQTELDYHWATERLCCYSVPQKVVLKIYPAVTNREACVRVFALLLTLE